MRRRLREYCLPTYGTKQVMWQRIATHEAKMKAKRELEKHLEERQDELARTARHKKSGC